MNDVIEIFQLVSNLGNAGGGIVERAFLSKIHGPEEVFNDLEHDDKHLVTLDEFLMFVEVSVIEKEEEKKGKGAKWMADLLYSLRCGTDAAQPSKSVKILENAEPAQDRAGHHGIESVSFSDFEKKKKKDARRSQPFSHPLKETHLYCTFQACFFTEDLSFYSATCQDNLKGVSKRI